MQARCIGVPNIGHRVSTGSAKPQETQRHPDDILGRTIAALVNSLPALSGMRVYRSTKAAAHLDGRSTRSSSDPGMECIKPSPDILRMFWSQHLLAARVCCSSGNRTASHWISIMFWADHEQGRHLGNGHSVLGELTSQLAKKAHATNH